jgi:hypothetical protein
MAFFSSPIESGTDISQVMHYFLTKFNRLRECNTRSIFIISIRIYSQFMCEFTSLEIQFRAPQPLNNTAKPWLQLIIVWRILLELFKRLLYLVLYVIPSIGRLTWQWSTLKVLYVVKLVVFFSRINIYYDRAVDLTSQPT